MLHSEGKLVELLVRAAFYPENGSDLGYHTVE